MSAKIEKTIRKLKSFFRIKIAKKPSRICIKPHIILLVVKDNFFKTIIVWHFLYYQIILYIT